MTEKRRILIGCIADDFTGGSDAASFLSLGGLRTILCSGIPNQNFRLPEDCEAVVIALKSRTEEVHAAVRDSLEAIRWLKAQNTHQYYFKYCSTFDSTEDGNIGPVADAILEELQTEGTILCPALNANGRTVKDGKLYVNGILLEESTMKDHPLTPMRKSRIADLMQPQSRYPSFEIHEDLLQNEPQAEKAAEAFAEGKEHWYIIPDDTCEEDEKHIISLFGDMKFLTGGSGILKPLAEHIAGKDHVQKHTEKAEGKALIVAGSCSAATHAQTLWYEAQGACLYRLDDEELRCGNETLEHIFSVIREEEAPLVYSYDTPEGLARKRNEEGRKLAEKVEKTLSELAAYAVKNGYRRIIAAGGETSGAVTKALGYKTFYIGESIAPGVPILIPLDAPDIRLVLKSGNFGQEDFFGRALQMTAGTGEQQ